VRRYLPAVRAFLAARWRETVLAQDIEDTTQIVFLRLLRPGSLLDGDLKRLKTDTFRAYLYGMLRNVAISNERRVRRRREEQAPADIDLAAIEASEAEFSAAFDRAWANTCMAEAFALLMERARKGDRAIERRLRLLRGRHGEGLMVKDLAQREKTSRATVDRELKQARSEFREALKIVFERHSGGAEFDAESHFGRILDLLR